MIKMEFSSDKTPINCERTDFLLKVMKNDIKTLPIKNVEILDHCGNNARNGEKTSEPTKRYKSTKTPRVIGTFKNVDAEIFRWLLWIMFRNILGATKSFTSNKSMVITKSSTERCWNA